MLDTTSFWKIISKKTTFPILNQDLELDVAIIGGGITGITTALQLFAAGKKVAVFDAGEIGGFTTSNSTGNLYVAVQPYYQNIVSKFNEEIAKVIAQSRLSAIDFIEKNVKEKNIPCEFHRRPWFIYSNQDEKVKVLEKEIETLKKMALPINIEYINELPFSFKFKKAAAVQNQARFNPCQYVISLAENLQKNGCQIYANTRIIEIQEQEKDVCILKSENGHKIVAKKIVLATHTPIGINPAQMYMGPYRSYVVAAKNNQYPEAHLWNLDSNAGSISTHAMFDGGPPEVLMIAGSHHKVGQGGDMDKHYVELTDFIKTHFPELEITYRWSAQHYQSADDVPYIGLASRFNKNTYIATGYFADGLTYGTVAGLILSDLILEKRNPFTEVYRSNRFKPLASLSGLLKENSNVMLQYYSDLPKKEAHNFDELRPGEGKVLEINREKCAIYKDENQKIHAVSAVCTHMKCIINWNNAEKTWDCPCHGSRFDVDGKVLEGPAIMNLEKKEF